MKTFSLCAELTENELDLKHYDKASAILKYMEEQWKDKEEFQMLLLRYYVEMKQGKKVKEQIENIDQSRIYIKCENRKKLDFWRSQ